VRCKEYSTMPEAQHPEERPCLHCMMVELIEDFFAENPAMPGEPDTIAASSVERTALGNPLFTSGLM
jgi:hypothetical protein